MRIFKLSPKIFRIRTLLILAVLGVQPLLWQNCVQTFVPLAKVEEATRLSVSGFSADCLTSKSYDACIYYKTPFSQMNPGGDRSPTSSSPSGKVAIDVPAQDYGILLPESLRTSRALGDSSVRVVSRLLPEFDGNWKAALKPESQSIITHLMSFHWSQQTIAFFHSLDLPSYLDDQGIVISTDSSLTGWSLDNKTIYLKYGSMLQDHAFDMGLLVHLLGEANIAIATEGRIYETSNDPKHVDCGLPGKPLYTQDCCASGIGCSKAITSGMSDYLVTLVFPDRPAVGDGISEDPDGMKVCGMYRNPRLNLETKSTDAYQACASTGRKGQVFAMGSFYASVWYAVGLEAGKSGHLPEFHKLYVKSMKKLDGKDDFISFLTKLEELDAAEFKSQFGPLFRAEYLKRGLL